MAGFLIRAKVYVIKIVIVHQIISDRIVVKIIWPGPIKHTCQILQNCYMFRAEFNHVPSIISNVISNQIIIDRNISTMNEHFVSYLIPHTILFWRYKLTMVG